MVFDKDWFYKHQRILRWFANTKVGRYVFRIHGKRSSVGKNKIALIEPNSITWIISKKNGKFKLKTEFRTHNKFAKRLFYSFKPLWYLIHGWDMIANQVKPAWNLGFDTVTAYPSAGAASPADGVVGRGSGLDESLATITAGAGLYGNPTSANIAITLITASTTSNQFGNLRRAIAGFDTSSIDDAATISSAVLSFYGTGQANGLGSDDIHICASTPAADDNIVAADFSQLASTSFGSIAYGSWSTVAYNDFTLNANGISNVSKTGLSKFGARLGWDINNSFTGSWVSTAETRFNSYLADQAATTNDPKLVVTYSVGGSGFINVPILGAG